MTEKTRIEASQRLSRISGQAAGIQKMVEQDRYCVDILTQISAMRAALDQLGLLMLTTHLEDCVYGAEHEGEMDRAQRVEELRSTLNRFLK